MIRREIYSNKKKEGKKTVKIVIQKREKMMKKKL